MSAVSASAEGRSPAGELSSARGRRLGRSRLCTQRAESRQELRLAPPYLERRLRLLYPLSLGLDEGVCQLTLRTWLLLVTRCGEREERLGGRGEMSAAAEGNGCGGARWVALLSSSVSVWVVTSLATVWYMRVVFRP